MFLSRNENYIGSYCSKSKNMEENKTIIKCAKRENFYFKRKKRQKRGHFSYKRTHLWKKRTKEDKLHKKEDKRGQTA